MDGEEVVFSELLRNAGVSVRRSNGEAEVARVSDDSRRCGNGACFVAIRGPVADGHEFIRQAVAAGAGAVVCEDAAAVPKGVAYAVVDDTRRALGRLAQAITDWPARKLTTIAVTGTNGKSTVAYLVRAILSRAGHSPAILGTIEYATGARTVPARTTTPGAVELAAMMTEMLAAGSTHLVMEVSSHALDQRRTEGVDFDAAVFTNLSGDHLDYHGSMEKYRAAKLRLFESLSDRAVAIINRDDSEADAFASAGRAPVTFYGLSGAADVRARIEQVDATCSRFALLCGQYEVAIRTPLIGRHNVVNCLAAAAACLALGVDLETIATALKSTAGVPGRLQRVSSAEPFQVFVDYAHTDDALKNVLGSLQPIGHNRILLVFGCGGDRDRTKRPRMARVAEAGADRIFVTSDNPRTEDPGAIIEEIVAGLSPAGRDRTHVEPDRRAAIRLAIDQAQPGDIVLIAGKGHETYQILGRERIEFNDVQVAAEAIAGQEVRA